MRKLISIFVSVCIVICMTQIVSSPVYAEESVTEESIIEEGDSENEISDEELNDEEILNEEKSDEEKSNGEKSVEEEADEENSEEMIFIELPEEELTEEPVVKEVLPEEEFIEEDPEEDAFDKDAVDGASNIKQLPQFPSLSWDILDEKKDDVHFSVYSYTSLYLKNLVAEDADIYIEFKIYKDGKLIKTRTEKVDLEKSTVTIDLTDIIPRNSKSEYYVKAKFIPGKNETRYSEGKECETEKIIPYECITRTIKIRPINIIEGDKKAKIYYDYTGMQAVYNYGKATVNGKDSSTYQMATKGVTGSFYGTVESGEGFKAGDKIVFTTWLGDTENRDIVYCKDTITVIVQEKPSVSYSTHVQTIGWQAEVKNGSIAGTVGEKKRLEAIKIKLDNNSSGGIQYRTHVQTYGWQGWKNDGEISGTSGEAKRLEAIQIKLKGEMNEHFDIYYRTQVESYGWLGWAKNGEYSGSAGCGKRLEAIQIVLVNKEDSIDKKALDKQAGITSKTVVTDKAYVVKAPNVEYKTHIEKIGWQEAKYNGEMSGTTGQAKRLEAISIKLSKPPYSGGIGYTTHIQTKGWTKNYYDGQTAGTVGEAKRLEAVSIGLYGDMASHYDVYYRVHAQSYGWLGWAKNWDVAGTTGYAKRLEGIQIVIVEKGGTPPGKTYKGITSVTDKSYISK